MGPSVLMDSVSNQKSVIGQNAWFLCRVLCRSLGDMYMYEV